LQGFKHANRRTMYVTGQERDANSSVLREQLKLFDKPIALRLGDLMSQGPLSNKIKKRKINLVVF
jgi:hypothetical protein